MGVGAGTLAAEPVPVDPACVGLVGITGGLNGGRCVTGFGVGAGCAGVEFVGAGRAVTGVGRAGAADGRPAVIGAGARAMKATSVACRTERR